MKSHNAILLTLFGLETQADGFLLEVMDIAGMSEQLDGSAEAFAALCTSVRLAWSLKLVHPSEMLQQVGATGEERLALGTSQRFFMRNRARAAWVRSSHISEANACQCGAASREPKLPKADVV